MSKFEITTMEIDGTMYHVQTLPGRKRPILVRAVGGAWNTAGHFHNEDEAEMFCKWVTYIVKLASGMPEVTIR
jgi:hypothetical protein